MTAVAEYALQTNDLAQVQRAFSALTENQKRFSTFFATAYQVQVSDEIIRYLWRQEVPFNFPPIDDDIEEETHPIYQNPPPTVQARHWRQLLLQLKFGHPTAAYPDGVTNLMIASTTAPRPTDIEPTRCTDRLLCLSQYVVSGADVNQKDKSGHDALDYAKDQGSEEAVRLLTGDVTPIYYQRYTYLRYLLNLSRCYPLAGARSLGSGAYAEVFLVTDWQGRPVAVKKFNETNENFEAEVAINQHLKKFPDPAWVTYLDHFSVEDLRQENYLVLEYVEGVPLAQHAFPDRRAVGLFFQELLRIFQRLEQIGIQHHDLHLYNIMVDKSGQLRLLDWGEGCFNSTLHPKTYFPCSSGLDDTWDYFNVKAVNELPLSDFQLDIPENPLHRAWPKSELSQMKQILSQIRDENWHNVSLKEIRQRLRKYFPEIL